MGATRSYEGEGVTVTYDLGRCIHAKGCVHGLPRVCDPHRRPWVDPDAADADGTLRWTDTRGALCRCGASNNEPFCDNSHLDIDFRTEAPS